MKQLKLISALFIVPFVSVQASAQMTYSNVNDLQTLITNIFGVQCQGVSNVSIQGAGPQIARFENGSSLGVNSGLVLSTGIPNYSSMSSGNFSNYGLGMPGDNDIILYGNLQGQGAASFDAIAVHFDFTPIISDTIRFNYIFASEEYPEYSNTPYNDRFLFLVSENGGTPVNIAQVPGTTIPVEINSINQIVNPQYYNDNLAGPNSVNFVFDGYTVPLEAKFFAQVGNTYHIKLVISDVSDDVFDSAIFLDEQESYNDINGSLTVNGQAAEGLLEVFNFVQDTLVALPVETVTVSGGTYLIDSLPTGMYHVRFTPDPVLFPGSAPSYFATSSTWTGADAIGLPCYLSNADIDADTMNVLDGTSSVSGNIVIDTSYVKSLTVPFEGALLLLKSVSTNETKGFAFSDVNGDFTIENVPADDYYLLVDVPYIPHTDTLIFTAPADSDIEGVDYAILTEGITSNGTPYLDIHENTELNWGMSPNPANQFVTITSETATQTIRVLSINGTLLLETASNGVKTTLDLQGFAHGVYLIQLDDYAPKRLVLTN